MIPASQRESVLASAPNWVVLMETVSQITTLKMPLREFWPSADELKIYMKKDLPEAILRVRCEREDRAWAPECKCTYLLFSRAHVPEVYVEMPEGLLCQLGSASAPSDAVLDLFVSKFKTSLTRHRSNMKTALQNAFMNDIRRGKYGEYNDLWTALRKDNIFDSEDADGKIERWGSRLLAAVMKFFTTKGTSFSVEEYLHDTAHVPPNILRLASACVSSFAVHQISFCLPCFFADLFSYFCRAERNRQGNKHVWRSEIFVRVDETHV
jgi:hypothetical protein